MIYAIHTISAPSHNDCLMLVNAENTQQALQRAMGETTILDVLDENNLCANEISNLFTNDTNKSIITIFSDDIEYV